MKVVFVAGLHRSGSTILGMLLQNLEGYFGLGEVYGYINDPSKKTYCECGNWSDECNFWDSLNLSSWEVSKRYRVVMEAASRRGIPVDVSKTIHAFRALKQSGVNLSVIYIVRDVRAWTVSNKLFGNDNRESAIRLFIRWYRNNRKIKETLDATGTRYLQIGYEELSLYPAETFQIIKDFLGATGDISLNQNGHALGGNRLKKDSSKNERINYDNRWFYNDIWSYPALLFPWIMKANRVNVYGHVRTPFDVKLQGFSS